MVIRILFSNIKKNKGRFWLILCCLSISIGLLIASLSLMLYLRNGFEDMERSYWGDSDIVVLSDEKALINEQDLNQSIDYCIYSEELPVKYKSFGKRIRAFETDDLDKINIHMNISSGQDENGMFVADKFLEDNKLKVGDVIEIDIGTKKVDVTIAGTFQCENEFAVSTLSNCFFTTFDGMKEFGKDNVQQELLLKVNKNENNLDEVSTYLQNIYGMDKVQLTFDEDKFLNRYEGIFVVLMLVSVTLVLMCVNVIYSIKKFILTLDAKQYAIIRSLGGNSRYILSILGAEAVIIGGISAILSILISKIFIYILLVLFANELKMKSIGFNCIQIPVMILINILLLLAINIFASKDIRKRNIKDILTGQKTRKIWSNRKKGIIWGIIFALNIILMVLCAALTSNTKLVILFIIVSILCAINLAPVVGNLFLKVLNPIIHKLFGNVGYLSNQNVQHNKSFVTNITMLTISIALLLLINAALYSVFESGEKNIRQSYNYDIIMTYGINDGELEKIQGIDGVEKIYRTVDINEIQVSGQDYSIYSMEFAMDGYEEFRNNEIKQADYDKLFSGNKKVILTNRIIKDLGCKVGDSIELEFMGRKEKFKIVGKFDSAMNNGNFAIASYDDLGMYTETYIKVSNKDNVDTIVEKINDTLHLEEGRVYGREDYIDYQMESTKQIYNIVYYLSIIPVIISFIMSITNAIFTFYENRKNLIIYISIGMSQKKAKRMYFLEQYISGTSGTVIGIILGSLLIAQVRWYMSLAHNTMDIHQSLTVTALVFLLTILLSGFVAMIVVERIFKGDMISDIRNRD